MTISWPPSEISSQTLRSPTSASRNWSTYDMLTVSPTRSSPASGFSWPVIMRKSVVLPAPFGPMTPTMPPFGSEKLRSSISRFSP